jgi:hypothetical protein
VGIAMARIRYLKPDFFKDEDIASLPLEVRLLYQGMWGISDKAGRLEDRPVRIHVEVFPYDHNVNIEDGLRALAQPKKSSGNPFILRYQCNGQKYIQILKWDAHQRPHKTEKESSIPPPPINSISKAAEMEIAIKTMGEDKRDGDGNGEGKGEGEGDGECAVSNKDVKQPLDNGALTVKQPLDNGALTVKFEQLWKIFPNRVGKKRATSSFLASVKSEEDLELIEKALKNYLSSKRVHDGFIQNGSAWFENWKDWLEFKEPFCEKCNGSGKYLSSTGYEITCKCPKGEKIKRAVR